MATFSKPGTIPRWADSTLNILEPPEAKKDDGWLFEEIPPSQFENWKENLTGLWFKWINERMKDGTTNDEFALLDPAIPAGDELFKISKTGGDTNMIFPGAETHRIFFESSTSPFGQIHFYVGSSGGETFAMIIDPAAVVIGDLGGNYIQIAGNAADKLISPQGAAGNALRWDDSETAWDINAGSSISATFRATGAEVLGGLLVGFSGTPVADEIHIGSGEFKLTFGGGDPSIWFDTSASSRIFYDTAPTPKFRFYVNGTVTADAISTGWNIAGGLVVGDLSTAPTTDDIKAIGDFHHDGNWDVQVPIIMDTVEELHGDHHVSYLLPVRDGDRILEAHMRAVRNAGGVDIIMTLYRRVLTVGVAPAAPVSLGSVAMSAFTANVVLRSITGLTETVVAGNGYYLELDINAFHPSLYVLEMYLVIDHP